MSGRRKPNRRPTEAAKTSAAESAKSPAPSKRKWYKADLHLHTPASSDYEQPKISYLEWLKQAEAKELDVVAITDHNTVAGVAAMRREVEWLSRLEQDGRATAQEQKELNEWRRLADKVLVLPGFEFTATFGFHILGIFPPNMSVRQLELILLTLKVPSEKLDTGTTETGASTDVLNAYEVIREAGGIPIAAHANSTHGVAMRNFPFGGQTKIAYTQDANLLALEITDLESRSYRATRRFFNGSKAEYPRRMHCIQGSDAHRLVKDDKNPKRLGIGDRATELMLQEASFEEIEALFVSKQFEYTRPLKPQDEVVDELEAARTEGPGLTLSFHESASNQGGRLTAVLNDVCAFANTSGGTIYLGANSRKGKPKGFPNPGQVQKQIEEILLERLEPPLSFKFETIKNQGANLLRLTVPKGDDRPYCLDGQKFYVRDESETSLAARDEIIALVRETVLSGIQPVAEKNRNNKPTPVSRSVDKSDGPNPETLTNIAPDDVFYLPQVGVEIVEVENRSGINYYGIRDLRNGRVVKNITRKRARKLWNYAISQYEDAPADPAKIQWDKEHPEVGVVDSRKRVGKQRYDLALREKEEIRIFYGVTSDGMEGSWAAVVVEDE